MYQVERFFSGTFWDDVEDDDNADAKVITRPGLFSSENRQAKKYPLDPDRNAKINIMMYIYIYLIISHYY